MPIPPGKLIKVVTKFHTESTQPGGVARTQAVRRATKSVSKMEPTLQPHLDDATSVAIASEKSIELATSKGEAVEPLILKLYQAAGKIRDLGAVVQQPALSKIASMLCDILEQVEQGTITYPDMAVRVFVDGLILVQGEKYRGLESSALQELMKGLTAMKTNTMPPK